MTADPGLDPGGLMKRSLLELRKLRARLDEVESAAKEPIAIIGLGCRFPGGARDPQAFWELLMAGRDAIIETPLERWNAASYYSPDPTAPGKTYVCHGGFLEDVDRFDAQFFGVSRREATTLDPQQRMLLEVAWEALEYAGQAPDRLYGTNGGVFIGIGSFEYASHLLRSSDLASIDPYFGTGTALSAAAGRLSFTLGLTGPSMAIDTACSASLVALHLACHSLRLGECNLALAGGVNLMLAPEVNIAFSKARLLAADRRCKTFDAAGDGYVRSEGCGIVVLKRLSDALRNGDRIIAQVRGSAVNQDGPSGALVVPNGVSQEAVIRKALDNGGVAPGDVDYIEAHGTGTSLGDPIEVGALGRVFGPGRPAAQPLIIGSVKTNIGHTEPAAGMAGLIKVALSLERETIPAHLHFQEPNPRIPWNLAPFLVPTQTTPWPERGKRRIAGVSSFGFTGTNAHVVVEEAPAEEPRAARPDRSAHVLTLSAKNTDALRELASRLASHLSAHPDLDVGDVCFSLNTGRSRFRERLAIVASSLAELREKLESCAGGRECDGVSHSGSRKGARRKTVFVFTAADGSYPDIGRELAEASPTFRDALAGCGDAPPEFALEFALAKLWESWGIRPSAVLGDGIGARVATQHWPALARGADLRKLPTGFDRFIEIGPASVSNPGASEDVTWIAGLRPGKPEWRQLAEAVARLSVDDPPVDWTAFDRDYSRRRLPLPTYPFQRERFWVDAKPREAEAPRSDLFYRTEWEPKAAAPAGTLTAAGTWLVVADGGGFGRSVAALLEARGESCRVLAPGEPLDSIPTLLRGAIYLRALDEAPDLESAAAAGCGGALELTQALARTERPEPLQLVLVTRGAQAVTSGRDLTAIAHAPLWGLGKVIGAELPWLGCTLIDLDPAEDERAAAMLLEELTRTGEHVAFRNGLRYVQRLVRDAPPSLPERRVLKPDRTYLVTGGLGGAGLRVAQWMAENGADHLALLGRTEPSGDASETIEDLRRMGTEIAVIRADVAREHELAAALDRIAASMPPLGGVIHAAGVFNDRLLQQHEWSLFEEVFAPKVRGAWNLHTLTSGMQLDFFVLFSSAAALLPSPGMAAYVAANTFLDALAQLRRGLALPALSIAWGPWLGTGMAQRSGRSRENQWRSHGIEPLAPGDALETLGRLLGQHGHAGVCAVHWDELLRMFPGAPPPYLEKIAGGVQPQVRAKESPVFRRLLDMRPGERAQFLETYLKDRIVSLLGSDHEGLSGTDNLPLSGVDSLMIMDVLNGIRDDLRFMVYPREFYEQPTIQGLARYLAAEFERAHDRSGAACDRDDAAPSIAPSVAPSSAPSVAIAEPQFTPEPEGEPLPGAVFVLSSPRSGSTLLRVMLAGHAALFSPPELHLLPFATMGERARFLDGTHLGEGLQRALMALPDDGTGAAASIDEWVRRDLPIRDVYAELQRRAGSRILIDKSPSYAVRGEILTRAERLFRGARYIHLVRHPYAVIESFVRLRMDKLLGAGERDPRAIAEEIWTASNRNILDTVRTAAPDRYHRVYYEDLVRNPREILTRCCEFLGVPFDEAVLTPYAGERMTGGAHSVSLSVGDPDFLKHDDIDVHLGDKWREIDLGRPLQAQARSLAAEFGYELPHDPPPAAYRETYVETARGLRLCLCSWGDDDAPLIVLLHGILEQGAAWTEVAPLLAARGFRVIAPDLRGHGRSDHVGRGGSYQVMDFVADVDAIAALGGGAPFTLAGHSLGSVIAALYAAARPDAVRSLVLIEALLPEERLAGNAADAERLAAQLDYLAAAPAHPVLPDVESAASRMMAAQAGLTHSLALKLAERHTEPVPDGVRWRWDPLLGTRAGLGFGDNGTGRDRYLDLLRNLRPPLTMIFGREPRFRIPETEPVVLGGGHNLHVEKPAALAAVIAQAALRAIEHEVH